MTAAASRYADKPWLALLTEAQRAPSSPPTPCCTPCARPSPSRPTAPPSPTSTGGSATASSTSSATPSPATSPPAAWRAATGWRSCCRTPRTSCSPCSARGRRARSSSRQPDVQVGRGRATSCGDAGVAALVCSDRAWEAYLRDTAAGSPVRIALTACELDLQTRDDPRVLAFERLAARPTTPTTCSPSPAPRHRRPEGRDARPPTTSR